jgi:hypothetical protein
LKARRIFRSQPLFLKISFKNLSSCRRLSVS